MPNLIVINGKPYDSDFRKYLMRAAVVAGFDAVHLRCINEIILSHDNHKINSYSTDISPAAITKDIAKLIGYRKTVILVGLGVNRNLIPLVRELRKSFPDSKVYYDVYDYFRYDARGRIFVERLKLDIIWRLESNRSLVIEKGLKWIYPLATHFDNASHMLPLPTVAKAQARRLVYVGSIDRRVDFDWLDALAQLDITLDIYGRIHEAEPEMNEPLRALSERHKNVTFCGGYDNDDLPAILGQYLAGVVPYKTLYTMTSHVNPDKIYHYLNAGLEVIATPIPQARRMRPFLHLVRDVGDLPAAIEAIQTSPRRPLWPLERYTWGRRWKELCRLSGEVIEDYDG
jgi:hypothetical protein